MVQSWEGLNIPTYFLNHVVHRRVIGPCVQLYMGVMASEADQTLPEVSFIWPAQNIVQASADTLEFIKTHGIHAIVEAPLRWLS